MIRTLTLAAAILATGLAATAHAGVIFNGISLNGTAPVAMVVQGVTLPSGTTLALPR